MLQALNHLEQTPPNYVEWRNAVQAFLRHIPVWAWAKDDELRYLFISRQAQEALGVPDWLWVGKTDVEVFGLDTAVQMAADDQHVLQERTTVSFVRRYVLPSGEPLTLSVLKFPIDLANDRTGVAGLAYRLTEPVPGQDAVRLETRAPEARTI
jgi:PAS domain-containing protein